MEKIFFNKLIRDKVTQKLESKNINFEVSELDQESFDRELLKKVSEEALEISKANSKEELVSEIADILFVIDEIKKQNNISQEEIDSASKINFDKKGGFDKKLFLHWTQDDNYKK